MSSEAGTALIDVGGLGLRIPLEGQLGLEQAPQIHDMLCHAVATADFVEIDARSLQGADISIVQLLVAARDSTGRQGKTLSIKAEPDGPLSALLTDAGLGGLIGTHDWMTKAQQTQVAQ